MGLVMNGSQALGWSVGRALCVALVGLWLSRPLAGWCLQATASHRRWLWSLVLLPFFIPGLLLGYGFRLASLELIHHPWWNEFLYGLLSLAQVLPVGVLVLVFAPPTTLSDAAAHVARLAAQNPNAVASQWSVRWAFCLREWGKFFPATVVMFLLAFQETEVATLMQAGGWPEWLFTRQLKGTPLAETLTDSLAPVMCEMCLLLPLFWCGRRHTVSNSLIQVSSNRVTTATSRLRMVAVAWLLLAMVLTVVIPSCQLARGTVSGFRVLLAQPRLFSSIWHGILFGMTSGFLAWWAAECWWRLWLFSPWVQALALSLLLPGLVGDLPWGLALANLFQCPLLSGLYDTPVPLVMGLCFWLLPRAVVLRWLQRQATKSPAAHLVTLLQTSADNQQRSSARELDWQLRRRGPFWSVVLLSLWGNLNLMLPSLLAPAGFSPAPLELYNQMHYGHIAGLWAMLCVTLLAPSLLMIPGWWFVRYTKRH